MKKTYMTSEIRCQYLQNEKVFKTKKEGAHTWISYGES